MTDESDVSLHIPTLLDAVIDYAVVALGTDGRVVLWNTGARRLFQHTPEEVIGQPVDLIFTSPDRATDVPQEEMAQAAQTGMAEDNRWHRRKDGSLVWIDGSMSAVRSRTGELQGFIKIMHDGTQRKRYESEIIRMARVDSLTGLGNRTAFTERLESEAEAASRYDRRLVVQLIDLDRFKDVNDRLGHAAGDRVLREVSHRIRQVVRKADLACRMGGDEFVVLHTDVDDPTQTARVAQALVDTLAVPIELEGEAVSVGASIGLSIYPDDSHNLERLMRLADSAMYHVKRNGGNGFHYASRDADDAAHRRSRDRAELKRAFANGLFELKYQPQIEAATGRIDGVEALLRCTDPALAHLSVDEMLADARGAGMMREIGAWVLETACRQGRKWQDAGYGPFKLCVNLCADEVGDPAMGRRVQHALQDAGLAPEWLELELTERQIFDYTRQGTDVLERLRGSHITLAIDDFGTGYSALGYLLRLPIDRIKLDRAFVQHVPDDAQSCALARAIVALAHIVGLPVVVEGIETQGQADFFTAEGCETLQGYFFGHPMPAADVTAQIEARERALLH